MWKIVDGEIILTPSSRRISFRTNISKAILNDLKAMESENNSQVNHLMELGLRKGLAKNKINHCEIL